MKLPLIKTYLIEYVTEMVLKYNIKYKTEDSGTGIIRALKALRNVSKSMQQYFLNLKILCTAYF